MLIEIVNEIRKNLGLKLSKLGDIEQYNISFHYIEDIPLNDFKCSLWLLDDDLVVLMRCPLGHKLKFFDLKDPNSIEDATNEIADFKSKYEDSIQYSHKTNSESEYDDRRFSFK